MDNAMTRLQIRTGDIFASNAQTLVNTVNTVGVMGKGIALLFKRRFPEMYEDYVRRCAAGQVRLGEPYLYKPMFGPWVVNFPTKDHWRSVSKLSDIVAGLDYLKRHYRAWGITSLAVPPLGCGNGQLEWRVVGPTLYRHLLELDIPIELYGPIDVPADQLTPAYLIQRSNAPPNGRTHEVPRVFPSWVALVEIVARLSRARFSYPVGRTMFQKIAYFATEAGLPTGLRYQRGSYGPFAPELKRVTSRLTNNGLLVEERLGNMFAVRPGPTFRDASAQYSQEIARWEPAILRVADLFMRISTQEAEVAATVYFTALQLSEGRDDPPTEREIFDAVKEWKQRRNPPLADEAIAEAIRHMNMLGWVQARSSDDLPLPYDELAAV
jgi:uncharacterized protein YwgA/O-acetyl-ADP-ribose deacetylase (regulator of RNase III)